MIKRHLRCVALAMIVATLTACGSGFITALRIGFAGADPLITYLEAKGKIDAETARELRVDFPDAKNVAINLASRLSAIPKNAPDARVQTLAAWQSAEKQWVVIVDRGHFKLNASTQEIVDLANSIFEEAIAAYGGASAGAGVGLRTGKMAGIANASIETSPPKSDKEIEASLKAKLDQLRKKLQPPKE